MSPRKRTPPQSSSDQQGELFFQFAHRLPLRGGWHRARVWSVERSENRWGRVLRVIFSLQAPESLGTHISADLPIRATKRNKTARFLQACGYPYAEGVRIQAASLIGSELEILLVKRVNPRYGIWLVQDFHPTVGV